MTKSIEFFDLRHYLVRNILLKTTPLVVSAFQHSGGEMDVTGVEKNTVFRSHIRKIHAFSKVVT